MGKMWRPKEQRKTESKRRGSSSRNNWNWSQCKPPRFSDEKPEMHSWEQNFCKLNGVSWAKILKTKEFVHQFSDITSWNDSAGKEAFQAAKARYWAQINGLQPETSLPDPDLLIDTVDHNAPPSDLDLLYQNLCGSLSDDEEENNTDDWRNDGWGDGGVILWESHYAKEEEEEVREISRPVEWGENHLIIPTGWI
ncbi:hypothetical protein FCM35_KLT09718 [Carex littledalei]|uniref:Uncharacterized protein n=1 Tax=Carex littledalei TaxID=544730 RepID=A0A833W2D1_9POAL|nr:hypothetical protein FCM35_KLT09718 [Carex littledalei]